MSKFEVPGPDGNMMFSLNERLAERQKVTDEQLEALVMSHQLRFMLHEAALAGMRRPLILKMVARVCDALEQEQQKLWNFPVDANYRRFWEMPGCACPKLDNAERIGTPNKIINRGCQIHGDGDPVEIKDAVPEVVKALALYADPGFYHAITIVGDRPTGGFDEDVSMVDSYYGYDRPMPGKHAREVLTREGWLTEDRLPEDLRGE